MQCCWEDRSVGCLRERERACPATLSFHSDPPGGIYSQRETPFPRPRRRSPETRPIYTLLTRWFARSFTWMGQIEWRVCDRVLAPRAKRAERAMTRRNDGWRYIYICCARYNKRARYCSFQPDLSSHILHTEKLSCIIP